MSLDSQTADNSIVDALPRTFGHRVIAWRGMALLAAALDAIVILCAASICGLAYSAWAYGEAVSHGSDLDFGLAAALFYVVTRVVRGDYAFATFTSANTSVNRIFSAWVLAFLGQFAVVFLLKVGAHYSRGVAFSLFLATPLVLVGLQKLLARWFVMACRLGRLAARRVFVVGEHSQIAEFCRSTDFGRSGMAIAGTCGLGDGSDPDFEAHRLALAVERARGCAPDSILVVLPLDAHARIRSVVDSFEVVPASMQLSTDLLLMHYPALRTLRSGDTASLELVREPLRPLEQLAKRLFDVAVASLLLAVLAPLFLAIAMAIKLTSRGPVFFRQERYCYNRARFRIFKFRSMFDQGAGTAFRQARPGDSRITPIGRWLRRTNLDELPQLLNVLLGDMSIVEPRPHAIAHDDDFEQRIASYARRHNIKPGITGWAQVNGLRGETDTDEKMRARVEHDLAYLDRWSLLFDIRIIALTVISPKAYRNAH